MTRAMETARVAWGADMPDWIERLAEECDLTSQNKAAKRIGKSGALVSQVLRGTYPASLAPVEELVRGVLMQATVACPALGEMPTHECQAWRRRARRFSGNNALTVRMYRACHRCPVFLRAGSKKEVQDA